MERILKQRDRLLGISARLIGLVCTASAFVLLWLGDPRPGMVLIALPMFALLAVAQVRMGAAKPLGWPIIVVVVGMGTVIVVRLGSIGAFDGLIGLPHPATVGTGTVDSMRLLSSGAIASV